MVKLTLAGGPSLSHAQLYEIVKRKLMDDNDYIAEERICGSDEESAQRVPTINHTDRGTKRIAVHRPPIHPTFLCPNRVPHSPQHKSGHIC